MPLRRGVADSATATNQTNAMPDLRLLRAQTRRHFLSSPGIGIGCIALAALAGQRAVAAPQTASAPNNPLAPKQPPLPARAKHVIYLHMAGSPSQLDLFEHKPELTKFHGTPCPQQYLEGK